MSSLVFYILIFGGSFTLGILFLWLIRTWAVRYRLVAVPNMRTSHKKLIPNIAGVSFYLALPVTLAFTWKLITFDLSFVLIVFSVFIFMIMGIVDDILHTRALTKLVFQALGVVLFILGSGWMITDFFGLFPFGPVIAFLYTLLFGLVVINAINMLDGIDGLAGMLGIAVFILAGLFCYAAGILWCGVLSFSTAGLILAFLRYNFSNRYKMLMGDTGSLWIGFLMACLLIYGQQPELMAAGHRVAASGLWNEYVLIALLSVPLFDFFRVFFIRLYRGHSPFQADRRHIHHIFVDCFELSHVKASSLVVMINLLFFLIALLFAPYSNGLQYLITYLLFFSVYCTGLYALPRRQPCGSGHTGN